VSLFEALKQQVSSKVMPHRQLFPTEVHRAAAESIVARFGSVPGVQAALLVNSLARGMGTPQSDLDMVMLVDPQAADIDTLQAEWERFYAADAAAQQLRRLGRFTGVHLDWVTGVYTPAVWDDGGGPDGFELEVGNHVAYSVPLVCNGTRYEDLRATWLPYYAENLRLERLAMVRDACRYDLEFVPFYVGRQLYFQAFDRLYKAYQEFLQALFIARRVYPLAYNKWVRLQVAEWLELPDVYAQLPGILEIGRLESDELVTKAQVVSRLLETWTAP
jgi:hypothetical protein